MPTYPQLPPGTLSTMPTPKLSLANVTPTALHGLTDSDLLEVSAGSHVEAQRFTGADIGGTDLTGTDFSECEFIGISADQTQLRGARISESNFDRMDAAVLLAARSVLRDVSITASRLGSLEMYETTLNSVIIRDSKLGFVNLRGAELNNVVIQDCSIDELDLAGAKINRLTFISTSIDTLDATNSTLRNVDLRGASLRQINGLAGLRGAIISGEQSLELAEVFANHLGLQVTG